MKTFRETLADLEQQVCDRLIYVLGERTINTETDDDLEFFSYSTVCELNIIEIRPSGMVLYDNFGESILVSIRDLVNESTIPVSDVIALIEQLETQIDPNAEKEYSITIEIQLSAINPLDAAKQAQHWFKDSKLQAYVQDPDTKEVFSVDLEEDDEDAVLPVNKYEPLIK